MRAKLKSVWLTPLASALPTLAGCLLVSFILHEAVPRTHDEFSYGLMGDTLASGRISNAALPLPEFFDTFHVLIHPVYASKYFPAQGIFLAIGERLTGHPAVGVWLSSALACAAATWMLQAWLISPGWGLLGGILMIIQYGVFSYWSQTYWGGMVAALGGALFFGAIRRLWDRFSWLNAVWLASGLVILANSRPLEGLLAVLPATGLALRHFWRDHQWREPGVWPKLMLPCFAVLSLGAFAMGTYNRAITGSAFKTPYSLHEQQYQESPPLLFLPRRPPLTYSSPWLRYYYGVREMQPYLSQRVPKFWVLAIARKMATWWDFYCGVLLSVPLLLPCLLRPGKARILQIACLVGFIVVPFLSNPIAWRLLVDVLAIAEIGVIWKVFDEFWSRLAIGTCVLLLFELFFAKWSFPHYFAPAACLVLYLQVEGLRRIWDWNSSVVQADRPLTRIERRRLARTSKSSRQAAFNLRWVVYSLPIACVISLVLRVEGRLNGWKDDPHGPDRQTLLMDDWSLDRANMEKWLDQQTNSQLVFVRYFPYHNVNFEWVYNHADIMHSHVIWARDLGAEHNRLLLQLLPDRTVWLVEGDRSDPQLIPYSESIQSAPIPNEGRSPAPDQD